MNVQHDGALWLSIGKNRKEKSWKNSCMSWADLVTRLQKAYQAPHTLAEYQGFTKEIQAEKKDSGGFVGGTVTGGRRKKGSVGTRQLLTLDMDYAQEGFWDTFSLYGQEAAFLYATHSHAPDKPRLRLIMPLSREVLADEYEAIGRRVAGDFGIDLFDDTTFQAERFMYWPATPRDVPYYWEFQDGPWLDADEVLGRYRNWKDSSQWPLSRRAKEIPDRLKKQAGDPHEKPGIIGAFCRTYTIQEVIEEYLSDIYDSTDDDNRYTYMAGSAAKGLVVYEDKWAFSHHGTDPVGGRLCNAFDLVRVHLYGGQDETAQPDTPINKLPSYSQMKALATKSETVRQELAETKLAEAGDAFANLSEEDREWLKALKVDGNGNFISSAENILTILANDPNLENCFQYNSFEDKSVALRDMPWREIPRSNDPLTDEDDACLRNYMERIYGINSSPKVSDAFKEHLVRNSTHPVREYLASLTWDHKPRIDTLLIDYFGAEDSEYTRTVTRKTIVAAVTRVFRPGCKFDNVLVLISEEGKNKSSFLEKLGTPWFSADFGPLDNMRAAAEQIQGSWIIEIAELAGVKKSDMETVMHFISKTEDRFRKAYGRRLAFCPRQCIFIATTNEPEFLQDIRRHRRWWPVQLGITTPERDVWKHLTPGEVRQIWAEAVQLYEKKEQLYLPFELEAEAIRIKDTHTAKDDREEMITAFLDRTVPEDFYSWGIIEKGEYLMGLKNEKEGQPIYKITTLEVWVLLFGGRSKDATRHNTKFITDYFKKHKREWIYQTIRGGNVIYSGYKRKLQFGVTPEFDFKDLM